jgi:hypothetical protein
MVRNRIVPAVLAAGMVFGFAACGDDNAADQPATTNENSQDTSAGSEEDADAASPAGDIDLDEAKEFVKITACEGAPSLTVTLEVTNQLDEPIEYYGTVNFLDGSGAVLTEGLFNTGTIEPGAKATEEIPGANVYEAVPDVTCELMEVKSDNPA